MQSRNVPVFEKLVNIFGEGATFVVEQNYLRKQFTLSVQKFLASENTDLSKADVVRLGLLPSGSRWRQGIGWHSYFGVPFRLDNKQWVAIGAVTIIKHQKRSAYPLFLALIYRLHTEKNKSLALKLNDLAYEINPSAKNVNRVRSGIIYSGKHNQAEHTFLEARIIKNAALSYENSKNPLLFRTVILSEDQIMKPGYPAPNFWGSKSGYLMATVPAIHKTFSLLTKIKLFICKSYFFS